MRKYADAPGAMSLRTYVPALTGVVILVVPVWPLRYFTVKGDCEPMPAIRKLSVTAVVLDLHQECLLGAACGSPR